MEDRSGEPTTWNTVVEKLQPGNSSGEPTTRKIVVEKLQPGKQ